MKRRVRREPPRHPAPARRGRRGSRLRQFLAASAVNGRLPAFLLSVGLAVLTAGFLFSGDFVVRSVVVQGNSLAFAPSIVEASGALGQPIFRLDTDAVARRVAAHPAVASVEVGVEFPDRVVVRLTERVPVLVWQTGDQSVIVDEYGWVIAAAYDPDLPRVVQLEGSLPAVGTQLPPALIQAARFTADRLGPRLSLLEYDARLGLIAHLQDGRAAVLGEPERIPLKFSVLDAALALDTRWSRIDLRNPDRPYYQ